MDNRTLEMLARHLPDFKPDVERKSLGEGDLETLHLPIGDSADYSFSLYEFSFGEKQIGARRRGGSLGEYFWYMPLELADFQSDTELLALDYLRKLEWILTHETRIIQRRGLLLQTFRCEYLEARVWERLYGHVACRGFNVPPITERMQVYKAPRLSNLAATSHEKPDCRGATFDLFSAKD